MEAGWSTASTLMTCPGGLWTQGPEKLLEELSPISAMLIGMSSRAPSLSSFHAA
jgi:hypothetical protein